MRVLHIFKDAFPPTYGGVEQHIWEVTRSLGSEFEHRVLTSSRSVRRVEEEVDGVPVVRVPEYGRILSTPLTPSWWNELRDAGDTILHFHLPNPVAELCFLGTKPSCPVVVSYYADVVRNPALARRYAALQQRFLAHAGRVVVSSQMLADSSPALARHRARTVVVPFGVEPDEWPVEDGAVERIRQAHARPIVLFLGRLVHYKGVDVLIEAFRRLDATLLVAGEGPERPRLEELARRAGLTGRVRFLGNVTNQERSAYYRAASVFVLPAISRAETFGIAMLEAMAHGTPAVSTEVGTGTSWVNRSGETGIVVPPLDAPALAEAIASLLANDELRRRFGAAAENRARLHFSKRAMLEGLAEVYRSQFALVPSSATFSRRGRARGLRTTRACR